MCYSKSFGMQQLHKEPSLILAAFGESSVCICLFFCKHSVGSCKHQTINKYCEPDEKLAELFNTDVSPAQLRSLFLYSR